MDSSGLARAIHLLLKELTVPEETTAWPVLIVISGLPGSGKSFLARRLVERLPAVIVESDYVRKRFIDKPTYSSAESAWVHAIAHAAIRELLRTGCHVISDATNLVEWHRQQVYRLADEARAGLVVVQAVAPESVVRERLARRSASPSSTHFSDADWQVYEKLKLTVEAIHRPHLVVDTSAEIEEGVDRVLRAVRRRVRR